MTPSRRGQVAALVPPLKTHRMMEWECHTPPEGEFNIQWNRSRSRPRQYEMQRMVLPFCARLRSPIHVNVYILEQRQ